MTAPSSTLSGTNVFKAGGFKSSTVRSIGTFANGAGSAISTGIMGYVYVPVAMKILGWAAFCDVSATLTVDVWSVLLANAPPTVTNTMCNGNYITITAATQASLIVETGGVLGFTAGSSSLTLVNGTPIIPAGSALIFNLKTNNNATFLRAELLCDTGS
jgi:hypothetical protein